MMRRLPLLLVLVAAAASAQTYRDATTIGPERVLWGHTGFAITGTNFYYCRPVESVKGQVAVTLDGLGNLTGTGAFAGVVAPDAVPGSGQWKAAAVRARVSGKDYVWNVTSKVSDDALTVQRGGAAPAESGTPTEWWYWNTQCHRSASASMSTGIASQIYAPLDTSVEAGPVYTNQLSALSYWVFSAAPSTAGATFRLAILRHQLGIAQFNDLATNQHLFATVSTLATARNLSSNSTNNQAGLSAMCGQCDVSLVITGVATCYPVTFAMVP